RPLGREEATDHGFGRVRVGKLEDHLLMERRDLGHGRAPYPPKRSFVNRLLARGRHWHGPWTDLRRNAGSGARRPPASPSVPSTRAGRARPRGAVPPPPGAHA